MVNRIKTRLAREESGFTLIELLVVIIILGILLAIAIPSYLSFTSRAKGTASAADVRTLVDSIESYSADNSPGNVNDPDAATSTSDSGYAGMTMAELQTSYDQSLTVGANEFEWVASTDAGSPVAAANDPATTTYCAVAQVGDQFSWKAGPAASIKTASAQADGSAPASLCT